MDGHYEVIQFVHCKQGIFCKNYKLIPYSYLVNLVQAYIPSKPRQSHFDLDCSGSIQKTKYKPK